MKAAFLSILALVAMTATPNISIANPWSGLVPLSESVQDESVLSALTYLGPEPPSTVIDFAIVLPLQNQGNLTPLLDGIYSPTGPYYHHFLPSGEFTNLFGPSGQQYKDLKDWAQAQGFHVTYQHAGRTVLELSGTAGAIEKAFDIHLNEYETQDGRTVYANDTAPSIPNNLTSLVSEVIGLDNIGAAITLARNFEQLPGIGSGLDEGLSPTDIKRAYGLSNVPLSGYGQTLGLVEVGTYNPADLSMYTSEYGLPTPNVKVICLDGAVNTPSEVAESNGDIQFQTALAPNASAIYYYLSPDTTADYTTIFVRIADDDLAKSISSSFVRTPQTVAERQLENLALMQMAAQGQSIFQSAGDWGPYQTTAQYPSMADSPCQPYICSVGGTSLTVSGPGGVYVGETTWNGEDFLEAIGHGFPQYPAYSVGAGGGGVSQYWPKPSYQAGFGLSQIMRNVPDVSLNADPGYACYINGGNGRFVGTSAAAPLWAAFAALVDEQLEKTGQPPLGFANPALYAIARDQSRYNRDFHDIADNSTNLLYSAGPGYDNATGLGSFNGGNLINDLAPLPAPNGTGTIVGAVVFNDGNPNNVTATVNAISESGTKYSVQPNPSTGAYSITLPDNTPFTVSVAALGYAGGAFDNIIAPKGGETILKLGIDATSQPHVFAPGVQLISSPYAYDFDAASSFDDLFGATAVSAADIETSAPPFGDVTFATSPDNTFIPGRGYIANVPAGGMYVHMIGATPPTKYPYLVFLSPGWNYIGIPWTEPVLISKLSVINTDAPGTPAAFGSPAAADLIPQPIEALSTTSPSTYIPLDLTEYLNPWQGYRVFANESATIVVPAP